MKRKPVLIVTLNPALDKTVTIHHLTLGKDHLQESCAYSAGGKGLNVARTLKQFRTPTVSTGFLGGGIGQRIRFLLKREQLKEDFIEIKNDTRMNLTINDARSGMKTRILEAGPSILLKDIQRFRKKFCFWLRQCQAVILSGRNACAAPTNLYKELIQLTRRHNVPSFLDTHGKALVAALNAKPFLIAPNQQELQEALGYRLSSPASFRKACQKLHKQGIEHVLISLGQKGLIGSHGLQQCWIRVPSVNVINDVGCGDALLGGYVYAFLKGQGFEECLAFAAATGTANCLTVKPGLVKRDVLRTLLSKMKIVPLC